MPVNSLRLSGLLTASLLLALPLSAQAQSTTGQKPTWTLGLAAAWSPSPYRDYNNKAWPLPLVNYEGKSFYVRGATIGYRLIGPGTDELSVIVSPLGNRFRHDDSDDPRLRRLSDRDISGMAGFAWRHRADWGQVQASAQKEFTGHGGGTALDLNYGYPITQGSLTLTPTLGVNYSNSALNNYYYGVSGKDALRSGLDAYRAGGGSSPYLGINAIYRLSHAWVASAGIRYALLPNAVKDSPMVDASQTRSYFVSLSYAF
jgi:outer membrane protein